MYTYIHIDRRNYPPGGVNLSDWDEEEEIQTRANEEIPGTDFCFVDLSLYFLLLIPV